MSCGRRRGRRQSIRESRQLCQLRRPRQSWVQFSGAHCIAECLGDPSIENTSRSRGLLRAKQESRQKWHMKQVAAAPALLPASACGAAEHHTYKLCDLHSSQLGFDMFLMASLAFRIPHYELYDIHDLEPTFQLQGLMLFVQA